MDVGGRSSGLVIKADLTKISGMQSEMQSSYISPLKQGTFIRQPDSGLLKSGLMRSGQRGSEVTSELDSIQKKQKILDQLEEDATGEYNRKGEVDRKALLAGSSIAYQDETGKKKKIAFKKGKLTSESEHKEDVFGKL